MERIVRRGIQGGLLGGLFGVSITVPWELLLGVDGPVLRMALPLSTAFALLGAWFASIPCLADEKAEKKEVQARPAPQAETSRDRLAA